MRWLVWLVCIGLVGCTALTAAPPTPTAAPAPTATAAPTFPPYRGRPFSILFLRGGNLWLLEAGSEERRLTDEPAGWAISEYAPSPDGTSIAYVAYRDQDADGLVGLLRLADGSTRDLAGRGDAYLESGLRWLDAGHLAYARGGQMARGREADFQRDTLYNHMVIDLASGQSETIPESVDLWPSPDGRSWATCVISYVYEGNCRYTLRDLASGETRPLAASKIGGSLLGWSADSAYLLFLAQFRLPAIYPQLLLVEAATGAERLLSPGDVIVLAAAWAPDRPEVAYLECPSGAAAGQGCRVRLIRVDNGASGSLPLDAQISAVRLAWTPDGERLVLESSQRAAWSVRSDGSDLRRLAVDASMVGLLARPEPGE